MDLYFTISVMQLNNVLLNIIIGGNYQGNSSWSRKRDGSDNCYKIYYIDYGDVVIYDNEQECVLSSGNLYLINGFNITGFKSEQNFSVGWLHFIPQSIYLYEALSQLPLVTQLTIPNSEFLSLLKNTDKIIAPSSKLNYKHLKLETLLVYTLSEFLEKNKIHITIDTPRSNFLKPLLEYIDKHLDSEISLSSLAEMCHVSSAHFLRLFTNEYKITPINYVLQRKMGKARNLLLTTNLSIKEIGYQLGFYDQAYFSRVFKKYYGTSPKKMREKPKDSLL